MDQWGFQFVEAPWTAYQRMHASQPTPVEMFSGVIALVFLAAVQIVWWRFDGGYGLYMLALFWMAITSRHHQHQQLGRACALMFPVFILVAGLRLRTVLIGTVVASAMFYALVLAL